ncbi:unnamed protein product, partial [marine sediment metagenome]
EHLQKAVWSGKITTGYLQDMEPVFTEARDEIGDIFHYSEYAKSPSYQKIVAWCERIYTQQIQTRKELQEHYVDPYLEAIDKARVKKAKEEVEKAAPTPPDFPEATVKLETPEDFDRLAKNLRRKAKRMRREAMTPEEILKEEEEKQRKKREKEEKKRQEELRLLEAETIETAKTKEEVERAKAKVRELVPPHVLFPFAHTYAGRTLHFPPKYRAAGPRLRYRPCGSLSHRLYSLSQLGPFPSPIHELHATAVRHLSSHR